MSYSKEGPEYREGERAGRSIEIELQFVRDHSYVSSLDGCLVVLAQCGKCAKIFEEEAEAAMEKIEKGADFVCLACDAAAGRASLKGITIQLKWQ